jgi:hypothetical protein
MNQEISYAIAAHEKPFLLRKLLSTLESRLVIIHLDRSIDWVSYLNELGELKSNHLVISEKESIAVSWGGYSQVEVQLLLMEKSREFFPQCNRTVFLQGTCFPIRPINEFEDFVFSHKENSGISIQSLNLVDFKSNLNKRKYIGISKVKWRFFRDLFNYKFVNRNPWLRRFRGGLIRLVEKIPLRNSKYDSNKEYFFGSAVFFLTNSFIDYLQTKKNEMRSQFKNTFASDEIAIHTFFGWSPYFNPRTHPYFIDNESKHKALYQTPFLFIPSGFNVELDVRDWPEIRLSEKYFIKKPTLALIGLILESFNE